MRKKFLAMLLGFTCALGCAFGFTACGGGATGDGGSGGGKTEQSTPNDKTEQTTPNEKPDDNKTEQSTPTQKPDNSDEKPDDDKQTPDKSDDDDGDDKTKPENPPEVEPNKYAEIVTALQARISQDYTNPEILTIYEYNNYLACVLKTANGLYKVRTRVSTDGHSLIVETIDTNYYVSEMSETRLLSLGSFAKGAYNSDGTDDDKQMVESMIGKLLGDGYTVMWGTISSTKDNAVDAKLGANASFTVNALLEKDGKVFEYSQTLTVSKAFNSVYGNVYQTVLGSTEANKDNRYKSESKTLTDLGEVAANYIAEEKRVAAAAE